MNATTNVENDVPRLDDYGIKLMVLIVISALVNLIILLVAADDFAIGRMKLEKLTSRKYWSLYRCCN